MRRDEPVWGGKLTDCAEKGTGTTALRCQDQASPSGIDWREDDGGEGGRDAGHDQ